MPDIQDINNAQIGHDLNRYNLRTRCRKSTHNSKLGVTRRRGAVSKARRTAKSVAPVDVLQDDSGVGLGSRKTMNDGTESRAEGFEQYHASDDDVALLHDAPDRKDAIEEFQRDVVALVLPDHGGSTTGKWRGRAAQGIKDTASKQSSSLLALPSEIRDKIWGHVVKLDGSLSDREFHYICSSKSCSRKPASDHETPRNQYLQFREVCKTCTQMHDECGNVFFKVNEWFLHRARLREEEDLDRTFLAEDTLNMFRRYIIPKGHVRHKDCARRPWVRYFRNYLMRIALSPLATVDLIVPNNSTSADDAELQRARISHNAGLRRRHTLTESEQCVMFGVALSCFVNNQAGMFQHLRQFTLVISLHAPLFPTRTGPLYRCGQSFTVKIVLGKLVKGDYATRAKPPAMFYDMDAFSMNLDPMRRMLAPLVELKGVLSVEVHRRWRIRYRVSSEETKGSIANHALGHEFRYTSVSDFLEMAGPQFTNITDLGLTHLKISPRDVVEIIEDDDDNDVVYELVPLAENGQLLGSSESQRWQR